MEKKYLKKSWISEKLEVRSSILHGLGVFTKSHIAKGEIVIIWGGEIVSVQEFKQGMGLRYTNVGIGEDKYMVSLVEENRGIDDFMNHSCKPNLWLDDEVTLSAMIDIHADEELTFDYVMETVDENYVMQNPCYCNSENCRNIITGKDWMRTDVQARYLNHFSPFLNQRIIRGMK